MKRTAGYTLIEILIVLFIISIVTTVAILSIHHNENRQLEAIADELAQSVTLAEEQAMLQPAVLGLSLTPHAFTFLAFQALEGEKKMSWLPLPGQLFNKHTFANDVQLSVAGASNMSLATAPQIIISTNGDMTPFTILIGKPGENPRYAVIGEADGNVIKKVLL